MRSLWIVLCREFHSRIRRRSFWLVTVVVPLIVALCYLLPPLLESRQPQQVTIAVVDETGVFAPQLQSHDAVTYQPVGGLDYGRRMVEQEAADALLHIPTRETTLPTEATLLYRSHVPATPVVRDVDHQLQTILRNSILLDVHGLTVEDYALIEHTHMYLRTRDITTGRDAYVGIKGTLGLLLALLMLFVVWLLGGQVTRSVKEERHSRVVELLVSSVRPFVLLGGKILGIGAAGLMQFALWLIFSAGAIWGIHTAYADMFARVESQQLHQLTTKGSDIAVQMQAAADRQPVSDMMQGLVAIDWSTVVPWFILVAIAGYLLYAALYAALGARLERSADTGIPCLLLAMPLVVVLCCFPAIAADPSGSLAVTLTMIPFTAPAAFMMRLPFGIPMAQALLSLALIIIATPLCSWGAALLYRRHILKVE